MNVVSVVAAEIGKKYLEVDNMNFEEAIHTISGVIDMYYEEFYNSEEYEEIEKAESTLYLLVKELKNKGITNLKDLK